MDDFMEKSIFMWGFFITVVLTLLDLDLGVFYKKDREIDFKESLWMSSFVSVNLSALIKDLKTLDRCYMVGLTADLA